MTAVFATLRRTMESMASSFTSPKPKQVRKP
jgi:hypothetical protein